VEKLASKTRYSRIAIAACCLYFLIGQAFIPLLGIEDDESLFAMPLLNPRSSEYSLHVLHRDVSLMLMSYLGTLKTLIFKFVVQAFGTSVWATREPMLIAGAASVWLFYLLMRRVAGELAAIAGCVLLAADTLYLLTSCFDWGPVALQHLLITGGAYALVRFYQERDDRVLAAGCFAFGLAMWDKALAEWMLSGLAVAALVLCLRQIRSIFALRRAGIAAVAFCLGALPLIVYNAANSGATFSGNFHRETNRFGEKAQVLWNTVDGSGLIGYLTHADSQTPHPHERRGLQSVSAGIERAMGDDTDNLTIYGLVAAVLLSALGGWRSVRTVLFAAIAMAVAWVQMAMTATAGGSVHHTILLWPLPMVALAAGFAGVWERAGRAGVWMLALVVGILSVSSLLTTNEYYRLMSRNGGSLSWTDAINPLRDDLMGRRARMVYCVDWGILDNLRLLSRGRLPLVWSDSFSPAEMAGMSEPGGVFAGHVEGVQYMPENARKLAVAAEGAGLHRESLAVISDSFGRPTFEVYRYVRTVSGGTAGGR